MEIETKEIREVKVEAAALLVEAKNLAMGIQDQPSYRMAAEFLLRIKQSRKKVEELFSPVVTAAHSAWKEAVGLRKKADDPLDVAERLIKPAMSKYLYEEEQRQAELERRAQEKARKMEEEARLSAAVDAEQDGQPLVANEILNTPSPIAPVFIPRAERVDGISSREIWKAEVVNPPELIAAIVNGQVPITAVEPNMTVIGQTARALKNEMHWPGVRVYCEKSIVGRG